MRLIDADALYNFFLEMHKSGNTCEPQDVLNAITNAPTIESEASSRADSGEAVAWTKIDDTGYINKPYRHYADATLHYGLNIIPLYTSPQKREWFDLTDEQISLMAHNEDEGDWNDLRFRDCWREGYLLGAKAIQAKLKEVNHG